MFTGLIEHTGKVLAVETGGMTRLEVETPGLAEQVSLGESIAVNGVCLTVESAVEGVVVFNAMQETLRRTALGELEVGSVVNLERALALGERLGGHLVQGHVDGVGRVLEVRSEGDAEIWAFAAPGSVLRYTVEKGSICVDGISLTVVSVEDGDDEGRFTVSVLPQTREATNLGHLYGGARVNLEADVMGKYAERLLGPRLSGAYSGEERP